MKKFVASMGLAVAGTAVFQVTCGAQAVTSTPPKIWNVSAALNGFYDDNYNTGGGTIKKGSFGFEVSPSASLNVPLTQTEIGAQYTYDLDYYEERDHLGENPIDQSHAFNLWIDHSFNEMWQAKLNDGFVSGQEPSLISGGTPYRVEGNNIANNASVEVDTEWSRLVSTSLIYANAFYDYDALQYAEALNRDQNSPELDLQWHLSPETMVFVGYQFQIVNYTDGQSLGTAIYDNRFVNYYSDSRDNLSHFGYVGVQHNLLPNLVAAARAGIQYNDNFNNPAKDTTSLSPYALLSLIYTYLPGCNAQINFTQTRSATDVIAIGSNGTLTQDQESSIVSASINHKVTSKLTVSAVGSFNAGTFHEGAYNDETDDDYGLSLGANYAFTRNFSGNVNYNYDDLESSIAGRGYDRNRISIGLSVAY